MTIETLKASGHIIFECIAGSRAYGLETEGSDTDIRGVFILPKTQFYSLDYVGQVNNETNDEAYYELRKFIALLSKNNPNILELLNVPEACVLYKHPIFDTITKQLFLSKLCKNSFANYAFTQIKKARGLNKKIVNPVEKERKSVLDFCYVRTRKQSVGLQSFLEKESLKSANCGLVKIAHIKDCYNLFYSELIDYNGIARENANEICLSSVAKTERPIAMLYFNVDAYSTYCKNYKEYWVWVENRNDERYKSNISHSKNYDAKNMMHTFRLLQMAKEIGVNQEINVKRKDREFLLSIKGAKFEYNELVDKAEAMRAELDAVFEESNLQDKPGLEVVNKLLVTVREQFYNEF